MHEQVIHTEQELVTLLRCLEQVYARLIAPAKRRELAARLTPQDRAILRRLILIALEMCHAGHSLTEIVDHLRTNHLPPAWA